MAESTITPEKPSLRRFRSKGSFPETVHDSQDAATGDDDPDLRIARNALAKGGQAFHEYMQNHGKGKLHTMGKAGFFSWLKGKNGKGVGKGENTCGEGKSALPMPEATSGWIDPRSDRPNKRMRKCDDPRFQKLPNNEEEQVEEVIPSEEEAAMEAEGSDKEAPSRTKARTKADFLEAKTAKEKTEKEQTEKSLEEKTEEPKKKTKKRQAKEQEEDVEENADETEPVNKSKKKKGGDEGRKNKEKSQPSHDESWEDLVKTHGRTRALSVQMEREAMEVKPTLASAAVSNGDGCEEVKKKKNDKKNDQKKDEKNDGRKEVPKEKKSAKEKKARGRSYKQLLLTSMQSVRFYKLCFYKPCIARKVRKVYRQLKLKDMAAARFYLPFWKENGGEKDKGKDSSKDGKGPLLISPY